MKLLSKNKIGLVATVALLSLSCETRYQLRSIQNDPVDSPKPSPNIQKLGSYKVDEDGLLYGFDKHTLYHWNAAGEPQVVFSTENNITAAQYFNGAFYVSTWKMAESKADLFYEMFYLPPEGDPVVTNRYFRFFNVVEERLFVPHVLQPVFYGGKAHIFLANEIGPNKEMKETGVRLFQRTARQNELESNFPFVWIAKRDKQFVGMHQLDDLVYFLGDGKVPNGKSENDPPNYSVKKLNLENYSRPPSSLFGDKGFMKDEDFRKAMKRTLQRLALIEYFGSLGPGFVVSYRIVKSEDYQIGVQFLDKNLEPAATLLELPVNSKLIGSQGHKAFVFHSEKNTLETLQIEVIR